MQKISRYHLLVFGLLLIFITRIIAIDQFPVFIDETIHLYTTERVNDTSPLFNSRIGRTGSIWWLWLFQPVQSANPIWVGRVATLLATLPGITALMWIAHRTAGRRALLITAIFLLFSPYHFFFERLALADAMAAAPVLVAIAYGYRLRWRFNYWDALLCGGVLALAILAKINVMPYAGVVLAAVVAVYNRYRLIDLCKWFGVALGTLLLPIIAFEALIRSTNNAWILGILNYLLARNNVSDPIVNRLMASIADTSQWFIVYVHPLMAVYLLISVLTAFWHKRVYLLLVFLAPLLPLLLGEPQETRYWIVPIGLLLTIASIEITHLTQSANRLVKRGVVMMVIIWGLAVGVPHMWLTATNPSEIPLPATDRQQYTNSDATGFGFDELARFLTPNSNQPPVIIGLLANCQGLRYTYMEDYTVLCRTINPNGQTMPDLIQWVADNPDNASYVVLETSAYIPPLDEFEGRVIHVIERASGRANLTLLDIQAE